MYGRSIFGIGGFFVSKIKTVVLILLVLVFTLVGCNETSSTATAEPIDTVAALSSPVPTETPTLAPTQVPTEIPTATEVPPTATPAPTTRPAVVALDPGHGGIDYGARCFSVDGEYLLSEKDVTLPIAQKLQALLEADGYEVVMVRDDDYGLNDDWDEINGDGILDLADEMQARVDLINEANVDLILSIHGNAYENPDGSVATNVSGSTTYYCADREFGEQNRTFADLVHEYVLDGFASIDYDIVDFGSLEDYDTLGGYLILLGPQTDRIVRPSNAPGALDEPLFMTNPVEGLMMGEPEVQQMLAEAYFEAIKAYFELYPVE